MSADHWGVVLVLGGAVAFLLRRAVRTVRGVRGGPTATGGCAHCAQGGGVAPAARRAPTATPTATATTPRPTPTR